MKQNLKNLHLQPHQLDAYKFITYKFNNNYKEVLLHHKPRSGKSFIAYYYMIMQKPQNVLLLTQFPILNGQWKSEFEKIADHNYNIINVRELNGNNVVIDQNRPNLVMISLQDAKGVTIGCKFEGLKKDKFVELADIEWDLIIFDEIHKGKETHKTDRLLNELKYKKLLGLSATPTKNILRGTFDANNTHKHTIVEETKYKEKYPQIYKNPTIKHIVYDLDKKLKNKMQYFSNFKSINFKEFSKVKNDKLKYEHDHKILFNHLFENNLVKGCDSILLFASSNACQEPIYNLLIDMVGDKYDVYYTNSEVNDSDSLYQKIHTDYLPKNGKKVIIVANRQLTTGITLKSCDLVVFMNDWKNIDDYIQAAYRCQSPSDGKNVCYTIDLNVDRAYNIFYTYLSFDKKKIDSSIKDYMNCAPIFENNGYKFNKLSLKNFNDKVSKPKILKGSFKVAKPKKKKKSLFSKLFSTIFN